MNHRLESFAADYPMEAAWIEGSRATFGFAQSMHDRVISHGFLTHNMLAAIHRCMNRPAPMKEADAPEVDTTKLEAAFAHANPLLRKPALNVGEFRFSPAPANGANPGAIYVKQDGQYLGKMLRGKFLARCTDEVMRTVLGIAADPLGKAIEHGKLTGRCAVCNRNLKAEDSVGRGIGPVCATKFGWMLEG